MQTIKQCVLTNKRWLKKLHTIFQKGEKIYPWEKEYKKNLLSFWLLKRMGNDLIGCEDKYFEAIDIIKEL